MVLTNKEKFNELYNITRRIMAMSEMYSCSALYVQNNMTEKSVQKAFDTLVGQLKKQLDKIRKDL